MVGRRLGLLGEGALRLVGSMVLPPLVIVVPCYNEEARLDVNAFEAFAREHRTVRFVMVNDGSADDTSLMLHELAGRVPRQIEVLDLPDNVGKAEAVRAGVRQALTLSPPPEWIGYLDADLAVPLEEIPYLFAFAKLHDSPSPLGLLFASRVARGGARIRREWWRYYLSRVLATLRSQVVPLLIYDTQCGAKFFLRSVAQSLFAEPFISRWLFDVELFARLHRRSRRRKTNADEEICEVPLRVWTEVDGTHTRLRHLPGHLVQLWRIRRTYRGGEDKQASK